MSIFVFRLKIVGGLVLASFIDVATGILLSHLIVKICGQEMRTFFVYAFGVGFSLLPDADAVLHLIQRDGIYSDHRRFPHYPIIIIPIFLFISLFSLPYAALAGLCLLFHYLHDSLDIKENDIGIEWFAPFTHDHYLISIEKIAGSKPGLITRLTKRQIRKYKKQNETMEKWLETHYLKISGNSISAVIAIVLSILIVVLW